MRFDKDYLIELELDAHFAMREQVAPSIAPSVNEAAPAVTVATRSVSIARPTPPSIAKATVVTTAVTTILPIIIDPARAATIATLTLNDLSNNANSCEACGLCKQRKQAVVGCGETNAPWLFVGEAPGTEEDDTGEPFVGQAGKLLDAMMTALGLKRGIDVYLTNVVKCRAPGNRPPQLDEISSCAPYLDRQIDLLQPKIILALGKTAIARLTGSEESLNNLRGRVHTYRGIPVVATFHPSYLLLRLPEKLKAWEDLTFARSELNKRILATATL